MGRGKFRAFLCVSCVRNFGSKLCEYLMVVLSLCLWKYHRYNLLKIIDSVIAKVCFAHVITGWHSLDNVRSFQRTFGKLIFKRIRNSSILRKWEWRTFTQDFCWNPFFLFYCFLSLTMETKQLRLCVWREFPRRGVGLGFCILGEIISEQTIVLSFFVVFELVLGRWYLLKGVIK